MTWFADLSPFGDGDPSTAPVLAVGWLDAPHDFPRGAIADEDLAALVELADTAGRGALSHPAGWHNCSFCGGATGASEMYVLDGDQLFIAPVMIVHYVRDHGYRPPDRFLAAARAAARLPARERYRELALRRRAEHLPERLAFTTWHRRRFDTYPIAEGTTKLRGVATVEAIGRRVVLRAIGDHTVTVDAVVITECELIDGDVIVANGRTYKFRRWPPP
jgi:hypothetical protein